MDYILSNLGSNKVTLDIKTNYFEESYEYDNNLYSKFDDIENIIDCVKKPSPSLNQKIEDYISDKFIYCVLLSLDETLTLVPNKNTFIDTFKSEMKIKINDFKVKLKKLKLTPEDVLKAIDNPDDSTKSHVIYYVSLIIQKVIAIENENKIDIYNENLSTTLMINEQTLSMVVMSTEDAQKMAYKKNIKYHKIQKTLENLNKLLVKDLKLLAEDLGIVTTKTENNKKRNLLKEELKDHIRLILNN